MDHDKAIIQISYCSCISDDVRSFFFDLIKNSEQEDTFSKPMPWVGMFIALASLFCILAMVADLLHGFRNRKLWFPCKYFTLNAASLIVIAVAMKLPVDLSNPMRGDVNQAAKIGSMALMGTMMANLMPSIATMDNMELVTNIVALDVLLITLIVNVCIQVFTGVVEPNNYISAYGSPIDIYRMAASFYVAMLLFLLILQACSALTILKSKQILESTYQTGHETPLRQSGRLTAEKLMQHVTNHWIMVETGSPQFIMACSATTSASGVICTLSTFLIFYGTITQVRSGNFDTKHYESDYKWSTPLILITQFLGILLGTIAPLCRCFVALNFKLSNKSIRNNFKVYKVESYWTHKLYDWKQSSIPFSISNRKSKIVTHYFKILILSFCIRFQMIVVIACKMIALIPMFLVICISFSIDRWDQIKAKFSASSNVSRRNPEQLENNQERRRYVLQLQDDMELADRTLDNITKSVNRLIQKAKKQQPNQLIKLLQNSEDFEGLRKFSSHLVQTSHAEENRDSWSLPLAALTTIAISLINFQKDEVDKLLSSVSEGLAYVTHVEENLNDTHEYVSSQKAAKLLWIEVEFNQEWLENKLKHTISEQNSTKQILEWFRNTAKNIVTEVLGKDIEVSNEKSVSRSICAYSMYCITESLLNSHQHDIDEVTRHKLFEELMVLIADIFASCLTNIPHVIVMKCHKNVIEKREASVYAAAQLLGKTMQIINSFQDCEIPCLNPDELAFFHKWCAYFHQSIP